MNRKAIAIGVVLPILVLFVTIGLVLAQENEPDAIDKLEETFGPDMNQAGVGTAFTYQGELLDNGNPASGTYDFRFIAYDAITSGSQVGSIATVDDVSVVDGLFTVQLDLGTVFDGTALWLEIAMRPGDNTGANSILSPLAVAGFPYQHISYLDALEV